MYYETETGKKPINPAHFVARYALKYVARASPSHGPEGDSHIFDVSLTVTCSRYHLGHVLILHSILW
jgi:hypothetical protein